MRSMSEAIAAYIAGLMLGAGVIALLTIIGGCNSIQGIAADIEIGSRAIKEAATPYTETPQIVYTQPETAKGE